MYTPQDPREHTHYTTYEWYAVDFFCVSINMDKLMSIWGQVKVVGNMAYVAQSAWIQSGTIEHNILFGSVMEHLRYESVILASGLK